MKVIHLLIKELCLFLTFGSIYFIIESIFKGHITNYRMFIMAGIIGILIGSINNWFSFETNFYLQCFTGTLVALLSECICGYQWNIIEHLSLWNYSKLPMSFVGGQINLFFAFAWFLLSAICIYVDDIIRWKFFEEEEPHYNFL